MKKLLCVFLTFFLLNSTLALSGHSFAKKNPNNCCINKNEYKFDYINKCWWENFDDPYLNEYINKAICNNNDLQIATLKVEEFRQYVKTSFGKELPLIGLAGGYAGVRIPPNFEINGTENPEISDNFFALPLYMRYEADLLLRNRDQTKSTKLQHTKIKYQEKSAYISLISNVAVTYFNLVKTDKFISLQNELIKNNRETLTRTKKKYHSGLTNVKELNDAQKNYQDSKIQKEILTKEQTKLLNQLAVLTGEHPNNISEFKRKAYDDLTFKGKIPNQLDSEIIFERPDIQTAQADLQRARIDIRIARKEFLPTFFINGTAGFAVRAGYGEFFSWNSLLAAIITSFSQDLFKGGIKLATLRIKKNEYEQLFEKYKKTDLIAVQEINDSLCFVKEDKKSLNRSKSKHNLEKDNYRRAQTSYNSGLINKIDLINSKKILIQAEQEEVDYKTQLFIDYIGLYKSVGAKL